MLDFIVRFLVARLQPADLISLGNALAIAGQAALNRQAAINNAISLVREGVTKLTN